MKIFYMNMSIVILVLSFFQSGALLGMSEFKEKWDAASIGNDNDARQLKVLQSFDLETMLEGKNFKNKSDEKDIKDIFESALKDAEDKKLLNRNQFINAVLTIYDMISKKDFAGKSMLKNFDMRVEALRKEFMGKTKVDLEEKKKSEEAYINDPELEKALEEATSNLPESEVEKFEKTLEQKEQEKILKEKEVEEKFDKLLLQQQKKEEELAAQKAQTVLHNFAMALSAIANG